MTEPDDPEPQPPAPGPDGPSSRYRGAVWWWALPAAAAVGVCGTYLVKFATGTTFTTDQWSAAGGWVGGIAAIAAVVVALMQSARAAREADTAKRERDEQVEAERVRSDAKLAEERQRFAADAYEARTRHREQLDAAERRHQEQLDEVRQQREARHVDGLRITQYRAAADVVAAIATVVHEVTAMNEFVEEISKVIEAGEDVRTSDILARRKTSVAEISMAIVTARLASALIFDPQLKVETDHVLGLMQAASQKMQSPDESDGEGVGEGRWAEAVETVNLLNERARLFMEQVDRVARPQGV